MSIHLVGISGSLRQESNNSKLIRIASLHAPDSVSFTVAEHINELPHFNPDLEIDSFPALKDWVDLIRDSDGLVISSPEYARGYPGALKNALDWLVQTDAHIDKPFILINASDRSSVARDSLIVVLTTMAGIYIEECSVTIPILGKSLTQEQLLEDHDVTEKIKIALTGFVGEIEAMKSGSLCPSPGTM